MTWLKITSFLLFSSIYFLLNGQSGFSGDFTEIYTDQNITISIKLVLNNDCIDDLKSHFDFKWTGKFQYSEKYVSFKYTYIDCKDLNNYYRIFCIPIGFSNTLMKYYHIRQSAYELAQEKTNILTLADQFEFLPKQEGVISDIKVVSRYVEPDPIRLALSAPNSLSAINPNNQTNTQYYPVKIGEQVTLRLYGGSLIPNSNWYWFQDYCGNTKIDSGEVIKIKPNHTLSYFARAESFTGSKSTRCVSIIVYVEPNSIIVRDSLNYANYYFSKNEYGRALKTYEYVLSLDRNNKKALERVEEIDLLLHRSKIFFYEKTNYIDNVQIKLDISRGLEEITSERSFGIAHIRILFNSDTNGVRRFSYELLKGSDLTAKELAKLIPIGSKYHAAIFKGYYVMAHQEYLVDLSWNNRVLTIKKNQATWPKNLSTTNAAFNTSVLSTINKWPKGKYKFEVKSKIQNNHTQNDITLIKYKCTSGPQNVILSMILPGLGTRRVVDGNKSLRRTTFFILTAGVSVFAKIISDRTYNEYLIASNQTENEKLYNKANLTNRVFIISGSLAASIYLYDIIYVIHKGRTNIKKYKFATPYIVKREPITFY